MHSAYITYTYVSRIYNPHRIQQSIRSPQRTSLAEQQQQQQHHTEQRKHTTKYMCVCACVREREKTFKLIDVYETKRKRQLSVPSRFGGWLPTLQQQIDNPMCLSSSFLSFIAHIYSFASFASLIVVVVIVNSLSTAVPFHSLQLCICVLFSLYGLYERRMERKSSQ